MPLSINPHSSIVVLHIDAERPIVSVARIEQSLRPLSRTGSARIKVDKAGRVDWPNGSGPKWPARRQAINVLSRRPNSLVLRVGAPDRDRLFGIVDAGPATDDVAPSGSGFATACGEGAVRGSRSVGIIPGLALHFSIRRTATPHGSLRWDDVGRSACRHAAKSSKAIQAGEIVDHCAAAGAVATIGADAPKTGVGIARPSDFDRASGLLALTASGRDGHRSGGKQRECAYEHE